MDGDQLVISSATGVDIALPIAGPGSRAYAFVIDWHFRALIAGAWLLAGMFILFGAFKVPPEPEQGNRFALWVLLPASAIYFLYHLVLECAFGGRTPGKRIAGVRLVTRSGDTPSLGALVIRNLLRLIDSLPAFYVVGLIATFSTRERVRIGDLAAGTVLVLDQREALSAIDQLGATAIADPATAALAGDLVARWSSLSDERRTRLARQLLRHLDPGASALSLEVMNGTALKERLETLLRGAAAP
ncbi:MAG: RDD family protein [Proteobacteria bacterium]|nr:RDD family protein [Pseudomonadota bacterium]